MTRGVAIIYSAEHIMEMPSLGIHLILYCVFLTPSPNEWPQNMLFVVRFIDSPLVPL